MSSVKKILIAIDGSEQSLDSVDYAIDIADNDDTTGTPNCDS